MRKSHLYLREPVQRQLLQNMAARKGQHVVLQHLFAKLLSMLPVAMQGQDGAQAGDHNRALCCMQSVRRSMYGTALLIWCVHRAWERERRERGGYVESGLLLLQHNICVSLRVTVDSDRPCFSWCCPPALPSWPHLVADLILRCEGLGTMTTTESFKNP